jgi:hypothetical protein
MQSNVEFALGPEEDHGTPWSSWPGAGPSGCKLTSIQQSGIEYTSTNISPYLCCCFFFQNFLQIFLCAYNLDKHQNVYNIMNGYMKKYAYKYIYDRSVV